MLIVLRSLPQRIARSFCIKFNCSHHKSSVRHTASSCVPAYDCEIECESLKRYKPGGYHPVNIGDTFKSGKYRVVQKLGWGGYSTVWLACDHVLSRAVALKIVVAEIGGVSNEVRILQQLSLIPSEQEGRRHLRDLRDCFWHNGPNGRHQCLVFDVDGVSVPTLVNHHGDGLRLPGRLAWELSKQVTLAVSCLHSNGIAHGDLYTGNILVSSKKGLLSDPNFIKSLEPPVEVEIDVTPGHRITKSLPRRIVEPVTLSIPPIDEQICAKLIDFEQSFIKTDKVPPKVRTPLTFRAPETLLDTKWDLRIDMWSLACVIFELIVGQPPFDNFMPTKAALVLEWIATFGDIPEDWKEQADMVVGDCKAEIDEGSLPVWLCKVYFDGHGKSEFSKEDIECLGDLLVRMMRYRPEDRLSVQDVLRHKWFARNPLDIETWR